MNDLMNATVAPEIAVSVGQVPGTINRYILPEGSTIDDALTEAGLDSTNFQVRVGGSEVTDLSRKLVEGDRVLLTKQIKGN